MTTIRYESSEWKRFGHFISSFISYVDNTEYYMNTDNLLNISDVTLSKRAPCP